ncbi:MAG: helix-turn-helix transcriptional regulator [Candidatus Promineifilaceae bacterium]
MFPADIGGVARGRVGGNKMYFQGDAEMLQDVRDYDAVKTALARGEEELVPSEVVFALLDGENPIKVWRNYRGLTQVELAREAGISVPYLSQIETNKRTGTKGVLKTIANALKVTLDDIVIPKGK